MVIQPTGSLPGEFDAVNSQEIQNITRETLPQSAVARGRYSIIFQFENKPDVEWKYASESARDSDYDSIIAAINAGGGSGPGTVPTLQDVVDSGNTTTSTIDLTAETSSFAMSGASIVGLDRTNPDDPIAKINVDPMGGSIFAYSFQNPNGTIKSFRDYIFTVTQTSTSAPTIVSEDINETGLTPAVSRSATGTYLFDFTGIDAPSFFYSPSGVRIVGGSGLWQTTFSGLVATVHTSGLNGTAADGILSNTTILFRFYY